MTATKLYCPHCRSQKPMWRAGFRVTWSVGKVQQYKCTNKGCGRLTVNPLKSKPRAKK
jgi:transposase-like protein